MDFNTVGVTFEEDNCSKVLVSCSRDMSWTKEGWKLFRRKAFAHGIVLEKSIETIAKEIVHFEGFTLALNVVTATIIS